MLHMVVQFEMLQSDFRKAEENHSAKMEDLNSRHGASIYTYVHVCVYMCARVCVYMHISLL